MARTVGARRTVLGATVDVSAMATTTTTAMVTDGDSSDEDDDDEDGVHNGSGGNSGGGGHRQQSTISGIESVDCGCATAWRFGKIQLQWASRKKRISYDFNFYVASTKH